MKIKISLMLFALTASISFADSLWSPGFKGYLSGGNELKPGDIVLVEINANSSLSFVSSSSDSKRVTFEFSGGEYGNLLSFLPLINSSGDGNIKGEEELQFRSRLATVVIFIDAQGNALLEGSRDIRIDGKGESLQLRGLLKPGLLGSGNTVTFEQLADARLSYTTLLSPRADMISDEDIIRLLSEIPTGITDIPQDEIPPPAAEDIQPVAEAIPAEDAPAQEGTTQAGTTGEVTYTLSDAKKKELLIYYINNLIDLIFN